MKGDVEAHQGVIDGVLIDQRDLDPAPCSLERSGQAGRARANDEQAQMFLHRQRLSSRRPIIQARHCRIPLCKVCRCNFFA